MLVNQPCNSGTMLSFATLILSKHTIQTSQDGTILWYLDNINIYRNDSKTEHDMQMEAFLGQQFLPLCLLILVHSKIKKFNTLNINIG